MEGDWEWEVDGREERHLCIFLIEVVLKMLGIVEEICIV